MALTPRESRNCRRYTDQERANALLALQANGGNITLTARQLEIPHRTLRAWFNGERHPEAAQACQEKKGELADACERIAWKLADRVEATLDQASLSQAATAFGILVDKMRLLRGQSTSISQHDLSGLTDAELQRELEELRRARATPAAGAAAEAERSPAPLTP